MSNKKSKAPRTSPTPESAVAPDAAVTAGPAAAEPEPVIAQADPAPGADQPPGSPEDEMKRRFREAMERKNPAAGAEKTGHGSKGPAGHAATGGPTQRMFRRKAGG
jgi:hypothetical protein